MKTRRKRKRKFVLSEEERRKLVIPFAPSTARTILFRAKVGNRSDRLAVAKYLAEEIRADPEVGVRKLARTLDGRWRQQREMQWELQTQQLPNAREVQTRLEEMQSDYFKFAGKLLKAVGEYLEKDQSVFSKVDHDTIEIAMWYPCWTNNQIVAELSKRHPRAKLGTLEKSVSRLLGKVPWRRYLKKVPARLV